jgi:predicted TIM-barrel fold metal-dependent hydrolase
VIDVSAFYGVWPFRPLGARTPSALADSLSRHGIKLALATPIEAAFYDDPHLVNTLFLSELHEFTALLPVGVIDPALPLWEKALQECVEIHNVCAIRLFPNYHGYELDSERCKHLLNYAEERSLPVIIQLRIQDARTQSPIAAVGDVPIKTAIAAARRHPRTRIVLAALRWAEAVALQEALRDLSNIWIDISCLEFHDGVRALIDLFGVRRLLFGTHTPFFVTASAVLKLAEARLSDQESRRLTSENAAELFGLTSRLRARTNASD